jgi:Leu/Phe-tRNA-protein transferase
MYKITVSMPGTSYTGGLYPADRLESALKWYQQEGYTVLMVENLSA